MKKINLIILMLILLILPLNFVIAEIEYTIDQDNPFEYSPDIVYGGNTIQDSSTHARRVFQKYDFSNVNETIRHAYLYVYKGASSSNVVGVSVTGQFCGDGVWNDLTWNNMGSQVGSCSPMIYSKPTGQFITDEYQKQDYDLASLINSDSDGLITIRNKWATELLISTTHQFYYAGYINYTLLDPNCTRDWECINWSLCQETQIRECNQAFDNNDCGFEYDGDYSEFGYPSCCYEDWSPQYDTCQMNNTQIKYYTDDNTCGSAEYLPFDNGTEVACDYCQPDLEFIEEQCIWNGTSYFTYTSWEDNNYYSCCAITSEIDDCIIDTTPYNETNISLCVDAIEQFELQMDENVYLKPYRRDDKVYATIWLNSTNETFTCQSYIKTLDGYGIKDKRVIQINPIYEAKEKSFLSLDTRNYEDREFFTTNKGQATIYYTKENIVVDGRPYLFGVECVGNQSGERLISEKVAYISYSIVNEPVTLMFWINKNIWAIIFTFIASMFIVIALALGLKHLGISKG